MYAPHNNILVNDRPRIRRSHNIIIQCVRKVAAHLQKVLEVMSTSIYTGLNPFNFIRKHFLQIFLWNVSYVRSYCSF